MKKDSTPLSNSSPASSMEEPTKTSASTNASASTDLPAEAPIVDVPPAAPAAVPVPILAQALDHKVVEDYLLSMPNARLDYPFGADVAVYKVGGTGQDKMFALIAEGSHPVRISLKCDPTLAEVLRERYESVMPGYHLNKKHWNTIMLSGQLSWPEVQDLIRHSYQLVTT